VVAGDIVKYNTSAAQWEKPTEYQSNIGKDIVCVFRETSLGDNTPITRYKNKKTFLDSGTVEWVNAGMNKTLHDSLFGLSGNGPEYNHVNDVELEKIGTLYNFSPSYLGTHVDRVGSYTSPATVGDIVIFGEMVQRYAGGTYGPLGNGWVAYSPVWDPTGPGYVPTERNWITLNKEDGYNYYYNHSTGTWRQFGKNIHVDHNSIYGIQGGVTDERNHLSDAAAVIAEREIDRVKYLGEYPLLSFVGNTDPSSGYIIGDRVLHNNGVKQCLTEPSNTWDVIVDTTVNKEFWFTVLDTNKTYISKKDNSGFDDVNLAYLWDHNSQLGLQGGTATQRNHLSDAQVIAVDSITSPIVNQNIYVDSIGGNDSNDGSSFSTAVKTNAGIVNVMVGKNITVYIIEGGTAQFNTSVISKLKEVGAFSLNIVGYLSDEESSVAITQHSSGYQLYNFDASITGSSYESDLATGRLFFGDYPMRGTNIIKETTTNGTVVINNDLGSSSVSSDIQSLSSVISINNYDEDLNIPVNISNLEVLYSSSLVEGALSSDNKFTKCLLRTNQISAKTELISSTIRPSTSGSDIVITGEINYDDLMVAAPATVVDGTIAGNIVIENKFIGSKLTLYGFDTMLKGNENANLNVDDFLTVTGFTYLLDPSNGGYYNLQTDNTLIGQTNSVSTDKVKLLHTNPVGLVYDKSLYVNVLDFNEADAVEFSYRDYADANNALFYRRDSENITILHSEFEKSKSVVIDDFLSDGTPYNTIIGGSSIKGAIVDVLIINTDDADYHQFTVNITGDTPNAVVLYGDSTIGTGADIPGAGTPVITGVQGSLNSIGLLGLTSGKNYHLEMKVKRFFY